LSARNLALSSHAATCAVRLGQFHTAVEFLEACRSIFWSQALQLRTPLDALAAIQPDLSSKLTEISRQLEQASFRDTSQYALNDSPVKVMSIESEDIRCQKLNEKWEDVIKSIRLLHGFEDFMQPKGINALKEAAVSGPIIILTANATACFALIVTLSNDVQYLELPQIDLPKVQLLSDLSRGLSKPGIDFNTYFAEMRDHGNNPQDLSEFEARLHGGQEGYINVDPDNIFRELLANLWKNIVKPVFDALHLEVSLMFSCLVPNLNHSQKSSDPPRLWWCPTGHLTFLPLHAAGIYGPEVTDCALDYVVSSYTPTLTAMLDPPIGTSTQFKMTTIIQPTAPNCVPLPGAREELQKIIKKVPNQWLAVLGDITPATVKPALRHLQTSQIVHFACHGTQDLENPLTGGLILTDGCLKVSEIMRQPEVDKVLDVKKSMSLAFLSACDTAKGDKDVPDEVMHLAATLLFSGFGSVVATMW
jgi:hypothetical protein